MKFPPLKKLGSMGLGGLGRVLNMHGLLKLPSNGACGIPEVKLVIDISLEFKNPAFKNPEFKNRLDSNPKLVDRFYEYDERGY